MPQYLAFFLYRIPVFSITLRDAMFSGFASAMILSNFKISKPH